MGSAGSDVVGVDWRVPLDEARRRVGAGHARAGQPRPRACAWRPGPSSRRPPGPSSPAPRTAPAPATSSTSGTASCPRRTPASCPPSSNWCTARPGQHDDRRAPHGTRHARQHGRDRTLLHTHPPRPAADTRAAGRAGGALRRHRRRVAAGRPHRGAGRRGARRARGSGRPAATSCRSAPSTPTPSSRRPPPRLAAAGRRARSSASSSHPTARPSARRSTSTAPPPRSATRPSCPSPPWFAEPSLVALLAARVKDALGTVTGRTKVIFTAHSLPERIRETGDTYPEQLAESARLVAEAAGLDGLARGVAERGAHARAVARTRRARRRAPAGRGRAGRRGRRLPDRLRGRPPRGALRPRRRAGRRSPRRAAWPTRAPPRSTTTPPSSPRWPT